MKELAWNEGVKTCFSSGKFSKDYLKGQVALISGAGGGIGYEAARALLWLGAKIIIAERDQEKGNSARNNLCDEFSPESIMFFPTDVGDEKSILDLKKQITNQFQPVDIVINNATVAPLGAVLDVPISDWDSSYQVNLRAPVLLAQAFIPEMLQRKSGVFVCVSSQGLEYMGAYEGMKAAQVHLANTLAAELENTGVHVFSIGPGFVPTRTALDSIPKLAVLMHKTETEMQEIVKQYTISIEAAGAGFAAAVVQAKIYHGLEISSLQALIDAGINPQESEQKKSGPNSVKQSSFDFSLAKTQCEKVLNTLQEQSLGWAARPVFERQWMVRNFKKTSGYPVETWLEKLKQLINLLEKKDITAVEDISLPLENLVKFYENLANMAKSYGKNAAEREQYVQIVLEWAEETKKLDQLMHT